MKQTWLALALSCLLAACGGNNEVEAVGTTVGQGADIVAGSTTFVAELAPAGTTTSAGTGAATLVVDGSTREALLAVTTSGVDGSVATLGSDTGSGGQLALTEVPPGSGIWSTRAVLSEQQLAELRAGRLSVQIASSNFPAGELRGSLLPQMNVATSGSGTPQFGSGIASGTTPLHLAAALSGDQATPATPSAGKGSASVVLVPGTRQVSAVAVLAGVTPTSVALVADVAPTVPVLELSASGQGSGGGEVWLARALLGEQAAAALAGGEMSLLVRSAAYPAGELRGRLLPHNPALGAPALPGNAGMNSGTGLPPAGTNSGTNIGATGGFGFSPTVPATSVPGTPSLGGTGANGGALGTSGLTPNGLDTTGFGSTPFDSGFNNGGFDTGFNTGLNTGFDTGLGTGPTGSDAIGVSGAGTIGSTGTTGTTSTTGGFGVSTGFLSPNTIGLASTPGLITPQSVQPSSGATSLPGSGTGLNTGAMMNGGF